MHVAGEEFPLQDGKAFCFQDSFFHAVEHGEGNGERISLVVRVMHPDLTMETYRPSTSTDVVRDFGAWDPAKVLETELVRLRKAFRQLAGAVPRMSSASGAEASAGNCSATDTGGCRMGARGGGLVA